MYDRKVERPPHGTLIRITNLQGHWTSDKIKEIFTDSLKLMSPFNKAEFTCHIILGDKTIFSAFEKDEFTGTLSMAPVYMEGNVDDKGHVIYMLNNRKKKYTEPLKALTSDMDVRSHFCDKDGNLIRKPECGSFSFRFYVFDLERKASLESPLKSADIDIIKSHRIYLYRDGVRIYPYGDPSDDWIELDIKRGTKRAGSYLSNDQVIGYIEITNKGNPSLRDKTNREGLMDIGYAYEDLKVLVLGILGVLKNEFQKYKEKKILAAEKKAQQEGLLQEEPKVNEDIQMLSKYLESKKDRRGSRLLQQLGKNYQKEKKVLNERVEIIEDLAGVGISVDAASHDLDIMIQ